MSTKQVCVLFILEQLCYKTDFGSSTENLLFAAVYKRVKFCVIWLQSVARSGAKRVAVVLMLFGNREQWQCCGGVVAVLMLRDNSPLFCCSVLVTDSNCVF